MEKVKEKRGNTSVYFEPQYGPHTNWRRNQALAYRKELKQKGEIVGGYVDFPAVLMGLQPGTDNYLKIKDFSNIPVELDEWKTIFGETTDE